MERLADFIYKRAKQIIAVVVLINLIALASFFRFKMDADFLSFFSKGNPKSEEYLELNEKYDVGESVSVYIEDENSLLEKENLLKIFEVQKKAGDIDGVSDTNSFIPDEIALNEKVVVVNEDFINNNHEALSDFIENKYFLAKQFLSFNKTKGMIVTSLAKDAEENKVVRFLKDIVKQEGELSLSLVGDEIIEDTIWSYLLNIIIYFPPIIIILMLSVFFAVIRSKKLSALALIPAGLGALWTFATLFWLGLELNLLLVIIPFFVIVMGAADGLHYVSHLRENMKKTQDKRELNRKTLSLVGMPIILTTLTTMAGFASLTWTEVIPMRQLGIFVALGIFYAGLVSLFFLPAILTRVKIPYKPNQEKEDSLSRVILVFSRKRLAVIIIFLGLISACGFFIPKLEVVSNQLMFFKDNTEIRKSFDKVESLFGGAFPLIGEISSQKGILDLKNNEFANHVLQKERELEELPGIYKVNSVFDLIMGINAMTTGEEKYPENPELLLDQFNKQDFDMNAWLSQDGFRMMVTTKNLTSENIGKLEAFKEENKETFRTITGMPVLFDEMNRLVVKSQFQSLSLALVLIFIMLLITLKKLKAALVGLIPIVITIMAILAMISITKFGLNILTANLSAITIGVGVDYAIHLISGIYYYKRRGLDNQASVDKALVTVSKPVIASAFGLALGLSVMFFSPLKIHFQVASVMWVAMVVSSMAALLIIPQFYRKKA